MTISELMRYNTSYRRKMNNNRKRITNIYETVKTIHQLQIEIDVEQEKNRYKTI